MFQNIVSLKPLKTKRQHIGRKLESITNLFTCEYMGKKFNNKLADPIYRLCINCRSLHRATVTDLWPEVTLASHRLSKLDCEFDSQ